MSQPTKSKTEGIPTLSRPSRVKPKISDLETLPTLPSTPPSPKVNGATEALRKQQQELFEKFQREKREKAAKEAEMSTGEIAEKKQKQKEEEFRKKQEERLLMFAPRLATKPPVATKKFDEEWGPHIEGQISYKGPLPKPLTSLKDNMMGMWRGIQGEKNSCYIDSTLFTCFAFQPVFDHLLTGLKKRSDRKAEAIVTEFQTHLRERIVRSLRSRLYVNSSDVMEWRVMLNKWLPGNDYHDPEPLQEGVPAEFLQVLFKELNAPPYLNYCLLNQQTDSNENIVKRDSTWIYDLFVNKSDGDDFPTLQGLLEQSFMEGSIRLVKMPNILIIQLPRWGESNVIPRVFPNLVLDMSNLMLKTAMNRGDFQKEEAWTEPTIGGSGFIGVEHSDVMNRVHNIATRTRSLSIDNSPILPHDIEIEAENGDVMELFGVLVIGTSHFCSYARVGDSMYFHDSMSDRVGFEDGENVPAITELPGIVDYLRDPGKRHALDTRRIDSESELETREANGHADSRDELDLTNRLVNDCHVLLYRRK